MRPEQLDLLPSLPPLANAGVGMTLNRRRPPTLAESPVIFINTAPRGHGHVPQFLNGLTDGKTDPFSAGNQPLIGSWAASTGISFL